MKTADEIVAVVVAVVEPELELLAARPARRNKRVGHQQAVLELVARALIDEQGQIVARSTSDQFAGVVGAPRRLVGPR